MLIGLDFVYYVIRMDDKMEGNDGGILTVKYWLIWLGTDTL